MKRVFIVLAVVLAISSIAIAVNAIHTDLELGRLSSKIQVSLGLTKSEASGLKRSIEKIYRAGAESRDQAAQALASAIKVGASGGDAYDCALQIMDISKMFDRDFDEISSVASTLIARNDFSWQEAFGVIVASLQDGQNSNIALWDIVNN